MHIRSYSGLLIKDAVPIHDAEKNPLQPSPDDKESSSQDNVRPQPSRAPSDAIGSRESERTPYDHTMGNGTPMCNICHARLSPKVIAYKVFTAILDGYDAIIRSA